MILFARIITVVTALALVPLVSNAQTISGGGASYQPTNTVGERLRIARARAATQNALVTPPYIVPLQIADTTVYQRGQIGYNVGNLYIAVGAAAAATQPPSGTSGTGTHPTGTATIVQTDGTVSWVYLGQPLATVNDALAPTLTQSTNPNANGTFTALTKITYLTPSTTLLRYFGTIPGATGFQTPTGGSNKTYPPASYYKTINNTTTPLNNGGVVQFESDAPKLAINVGSSSTVAFNFRIMVDAHDGHGWRYIQQSAFVVPNGLGDPQYGVILDWTTVGGKKARSYRLEAGANIGLNSVRTMPTDIVYNTPIADDINVYFTSDSWGEGTAGSILGSGNNLPAMGMGWQMAKRLGIDNFLCDCAGGTGYLATNGGTANNYLTRTTLNAAAQGAADAIIYDEAIINDGGGGFTAAQIQAQAILTYAQARTNNPKAPIIVLGAGITTTATQTSLAPGDGALAAAVAARQAAGDTNIYFMSRISDAQGPWSFGTGKSSAPTGDGICDFVCASDAVHNTDFGHDYEGRRLADAFSNYVLPLIP